jgi:hypothetical protein
MRIENTLITSTAASIAARSPAVGLSGLRAAGRLPSFIRHAISSTLASVAVRFDPKIDVPSANPSGAPRPTRTSAQHRPFHMFWRACDVIEPYGT